MIDISRATKNATYLNYTHSFGLIINVVGFHSVAVFEISVYNYSKDNHLHPLNGIIY
jgi:hypothetical protein